MRISDWSSDVGSSDLKKRIVVNIQTDGDLLYAPGALWTAAHQGIPILNVMHNNRAYHQEMMHIQRMANRTERGIDSDGNGTTNTDPDVDFESLARGQGGRTEESRAGEEGVRPGSKRGERRTK